MISLGSLNFAAGKIDEAAATYKKALDVNPGGAAAKLGLGKVAFNKGNVEGALGYFRDVVATAPNAPQAVEAEAFIGAL